MSFDNNDSQKIFRVTLVTPEGEHTIEVDRREHIWDAALRQGLKLPALCRQGWCLTCACRRDGPGEIEQSNSEVFSPADHEAGFVLPCTGKPCSDLRMFTHQAEAMRRHRLQKKLPVPYSDPEGLKL